MIKQWNLMPSPCDRDESRYKLLISCSDADLTELVKFLGSDAGKPFTPLSQEYNFAIYVYNLSAGKKSETEGFLKGKSGLDKINDTKGGGDLEEILEKVVESAPAEPAAAVVQPVPPEQPSRNKEEKPAVSYPEKKPDTGDFWKPKLNLKYVFDEFIVGANNRFVHAAAWAVSQAPGRTYNPLFIYGGVGLGKTHIMQAIGNTIKEKNPSAKILYITTEKFTAEVIEAIKSGKLLDFRQHYRDLDLLLVDDIQFLSEAESTQEEFFHTFNILHENQKQIVITSDKPPKKLAGIEDRLKSRFEWGLIADIKPPDLETRVAILKRKAQNEKIEVDDRILIYIATKLKSNIRELEGFLKRIKAYSAMTNMPMSMEMVRDFIGELLPESEIEVPPEKTVPVPPSPVAPPPVEKVVREIPKEVSAPARPVVPSAEVKNTAPPAPVYSVPPTPAAKSDYDLLKPVEIAYFYPEKCEKEFEKMKEQFVEVIKKHKLKFRLAGVFEKSYDFDKKINYSLFSQLCKTNNMSIAIVLGPPPSSLIAEDEFGNTLAGICESDNISAEIIPFADLTKQYKYLNVALDITLIKNAAQNLTNGK